MAAKLLKTTTFIVFAWVASGQTPVPSSTDRIFRFVHIESPQGFQEMTNTMRAITEMQQVAADSTAKNLAVHGTPEQVALAEWLFQALDEPAGVRAAPALEYRLPDRGPSVRIFYLTSSPTPQATQEIVNTLRSIVDIQRVTVFNPVRAVVLRGSAEQSAAAEWLIPALDRPSGVQPPAKLEYHLTADPRAPVARVFYLRNTATPQGLQEIINAIRSLAEVQRVTACNQPKAVALRGSADQVSLAEWLIAKLDIGPPAQPTAPLEYHLPSSSDGEVRLFYPSHNPSYQELQELLHQVRAVAGIQRATICFGPKALIVRGTMEQAALAQRLVQERDKPAAQ